MVLCVVAPQTVVARPARATGHSLKRPLAVSRRGGALAAFGGWQKVSTAEPDVADATLLKEDVVEELGDKTARDNLFTGGFAGGEKVLNEFREEVVEKGAYTVKDDGIRGPKNLSQAERMAAEFDLAKDFGTCAGGFPGGEVGLQSFNATGKVPTRSAPPTLGWGPGVLALAVLAYGVGYLGTGSVNPTDMIEKVDVTAVTSTAGTTAAKLAEAEESLPVPVKDVLQKVALGAVGIFALSLGLSKALESIASAADKGIRVALFAVATAAVAAKILDLI